MIADPPLSLDAARALLADEWRRANPKTPDEVAAFYRRAEGQVADLAAWHATPPRQLWTKMLLYTAEQIKAQTVVDIGCGAGHDLRALREKLPDLTLYGVEPNEKQRALIAETTFADVADAPIETADLLVCVDVLEHVPEPEDFLGRIAQRARLGAVLFESTATFDCGTPLHLPENRGWHPGRVLERHGWRVLEVRQDRVRVWQRMTEQGITRQGLLVCAYRGLAVPTHESILSLLTKEIWHRQALQYGDALISRSRSIIVSNWWRSTNDDVFFMLDDDISFRPEDADKLCELAREKRSIAVAAYPVRNGGHLAIRGLGKAVTFGPDVEPVEIRYGATGFMACHRDVLDALIPTMPLCHGNQPRAFWPLFQPMVIEDDAAGGHNYLSEDWAFCELARRAGFKVWLDGSIKLEHLAVIPINVNNMDKIHGALGGVGLA